MNDNQSKNTAANLSTHRQALLESLDIHVGLRKKSKMKSQKTPSQLKTSAWNCSFDTELLTLN